MPKSQFTRADTQRKVNRTGKVITIDCAIDKQAKSEEAVENDLWNEPVYDLNWSECEIKLNRWKTRNQKSAKRRKFIVGEWEMAEEVENKMEKMEKSMEAITISGRIENRMLNGNGNENEEKVQL